MSELKRVPFTTFKDSIMDGSGSGSGATATAGGDILSITSATLSRKGSFGATAAAFIQGHSLDLPSGSINNNGSGSGSGGCSAISGASTMMSMTSAATVTATSTISSPLDVTTSQQQTSKTFRLDLELFEPNSNSFPEFNYLKLVHLEKKKLKKLSKANGFSDPFEENEDELTKIAKELEKKYGTSYGSGRRQSKRDDYYDRGAGYDESDSFIDNTEAYDEIIPEEVETGEGGFYINSGALEFKRLSDYDRVEEIQVVKTKKRALSSSSSSSSSEDETETTNDVDEPEAGNSSPKDSSVSSKFKNGHIEKKHKHSDGNDNELPISGNANGGSKSKPKDKKSTSEKLKMKDEEFDDDGSEAGKEKMVKTTTVKDMLKAKRDNFRKMQEEEENRMKMLNGENIKGFPTKENISDSSGESDSDDGPDEKKFKKSNEDEPEKIRASDVQLPLDLPEHLVRCIQEIKDTAKSRNLVGKNFVFDDKITEIFLRLDEGCLSLDKTIRNQIFAHVEFQLSLVKYCLLRKAKQLRIKQERSKTKKAFMKLRKAVSEVMPSILSNYEITRAKVDEIRAKIPASELEKMDCPPKYPKKKFPWNDTLRNLLYDLFLLRVSSYSVLHTKKENVEDFVENYFKEKVVGIWPSGWIKYEELKREIEKRKQLAKKSKDCVSSKKSISGENLFLEKNKLNDETSITIVEKSSTNITETVPKSLLNSNNNSSNNALSIVSSKDLVVTITTKNTDKSSLEVPHASAQTNSVSITQVPVKANDVSGNSALLGKTDLNTLQKNYKTTITSKSCKNSINSNNNNNNNNNSKNLLSGSNDSTQLYKAGGTVSGGDKNMGELNSYQKSSSNQGPNKNLIDKMSSSKRATDHSITNIISVPPLPIQHSKVNPSTIDKNSTHIITIDHLKNANEIINTTNQLLGNSNSNTSVNPAGNILSGNSANETCSIRVRSVANVNNTIECDKTKDLTQFSSQGNNTVNSSSSSNLKKTDRKSDCDSSNESDGVEIVGVYSIDTKKSVNSSSSSGRKMPSNKSVNQEDSGFIKQKSSGSHKTKSSTETRLNTVIAPPTTTNVDQKPALPVIPPSSSSKPATAGGTEEKESELDYYQIYRALKDLEQMQESSMRQASDSVTSGKKSSATSVTGVNTTVHSSFGKDLKQ